MASAIPLLVKAPNKKFVDELFINVFSKTEDNIDLPQALQISPDESQQLVSELRTLIQQYLLGSLVSGEVQANLRDLIGKILDHHAQEWREALISNQPSLPKMVDIKSGSEAISRMSVPTVLVDLKVSKPPTNEKAEAVPQSVIFELNIETINTIMDSLKFVQGQLNSIK